EDINAILPSFPRTSGRTDRFGVSERFNEPAHISLRRTGGRCTAAHHGCVRGELDQCPIRPAIDPGQHTFEHVALVSADEPILIETEVGFYGLRTLARRRYVPHGHGRSPNGNLFTRRIALLKVP